LVDVEVEAVDCAMDVGDVGSVEGVELIVRSVIVTSSSCSTAAINRHVSSSNSGNGFALPAAFRASCHACSLAIARSSFPFV
jgi:hypothetical protein